MEHQHPICDKCKEDLVCMMGTGWTCMNDDCITNGGPEIHVDEFACPNEVAAETLKYLDD